MKQSPKLLFFIMAFSFTVGNAFCENTFLNQYPVVREYDLSPSSRTSILQFPNSSVTMHGSTASFSFIAVTISNKSNDFTADGNATVYFIDASSGAVTATLPLASTTVNLVYYIYKTDSTLNDVTIVPSGSNLIRGASNLILNAPHNYVVLISNGSGWN